MKNKSLKTNKQGLTFIADCLNITLTQLVFYYTADDDFKEVVDNTINQLNPRRKQNGLEKLNVMKYVKSLVEQN